MRRSKWTVAAAVRGALGAFALAVGTAVILSSCAGELRGDPASYQVSRSSSAFCDAVPVFTRHCATAACHSGSDPSSGLDLSANGIESRLVGVKAKNNGCESRLLIDPSDPAQSFLLEKIDKAKPSCGAQMPLVGDITTEERACIHAWVTDIVAGDGGDAGRVGPSGSTDASSVRAGTADASIGDSGGSR